MNIIKKSDLILQARYKIIEQIGQGGSGITYIAEDTQTNSQVAIKVLSLSGLNDWKRIDLFEREAKILQQLNHAAIPDYLDYFQIETEDDLSFYIVQELAPGQSLATLIEKGWQPDESTVKNITQQVLDVLIYLQELNPPVIHRDIKPQNIIYQPDTDKLFLVDFGAVQNTYHNTIMGSTVVGTYGYMSPEQYRGGAVLSTDLYGLGCTILFLLTGKSPAELPQRKLKINFRSAVKIKKDFANWIEKLIEPDIKHRFDKAIDALVILQDLKSLKNYRQVSSEKPDYSNIKITYARHGMKIAIEIPPLIFHKKNKINVYLFLAWYALLTLTAIIISISFSWWGLVYAIIFFTETLIPNRATLVTLLPKMYFLLCLSIMAFVIFSQNPLFFIFILPHLLEIFSNPSGHQKLLKEIFYPTYIEANPLEIRIKRGLEFWYRKDGIKSWGVHELMRMSKFWIFHDALISQKIQKPQLLSAKEYEFGALLTQEEKLWLETEIVKRVMGGKSEYDD